MTYHDERANADIIVPEGYKKVPAVSNRQVVYDFGFQHPEAAYELRIRFDAYPWELVEDCAARNRREPGSCVMADPDAKSPLWAMTIRMNLSGGDPGRLSFFPDAAVEREFGGHWGLTSDLFRIADLDFAGPYLIGQINQVHKNIVGTYTFIHVADSAETLLELNEGTFHAVRFRSLSAS